MRFRLWRALAVMGSLICGSAAFAATDAKLNSSPPNILIILVDDLRADALGVTGHPFFKSPNIDRIAKEGVLFQNAFVVHSVCSPSRATLLTGLYTHHHRVFENNIPLDPRLSTVPKILQASGYETALIGKWHMGYNDDQPKPGFNRWVSFFGQGKYLDPLINVDGRQIQATGHMTDILTDYALEFLGRDRQQPFFLILSHKAVHDPFTAQPRFSGQYKNANIVLPQTWGENLSTKPAFLEEYGRFFSNLDFKKRTQWYYECLAGVEESVGKILAKLAEKKTLDSTLIIFIGDNGYMLGEHNLSDKRLAYEESIRIPLFVRYPKWFTPGSRANTMALNLDVAPTLLEAAGIGAARNLPGISLQKLASGEVKRNNFLYQYFFDPITSMVPPIRAIRTHDYKYITYADFNATNELYDLRNDPIEKNNLIDNPAFAPILRRLRFQLDSLRLAAGDTSELDTAVEERANGAPALFELHQNYPNPLQANEISGRAVTTIRYALYKSVPVRLEIFDATGRKVATLVEAIQGPGVRMIQWNASHHPNGVYLCRLQVGAAVQTRKMVVLR
jgi:N-acetylglucosamine-6-sulfatase